MNFVISIISVLIFSVFVYLIYQWLSKSSTDSIDEIIYFYRDGCGACTMFERTWLQLASNHDFKMTKIDVLKNEDTSFYYSVTVTPTIILKKNNKWKKLEGYRDYNELKREI